jgi:hypothetical protein
MSANTIDAGINGLRITVIAINRSIQTITCSRIAIVSCAGIVIAATVLLENAFSCSIHEIIGT